MPPQVSDLISNLVAVIMFGIGIYLHLKGITLNGQQQTAASQLLGALFDSIAGVVIFVRQQHNAAMKAIQKHNDDPLAHLTPGSPVSQRWGEAKENAVKKVLSIALMLSAALFVLSGCAASNSGTPAAIPPAQVLAAANQSVSIVETVLNDLHATNAFSATDWSHIVSVEAGIGAALDAWQQNLGQPGAAQAQAAFEAALPDLLQLVQSGQKTAAKMKGG